MLKKQKKQKKLFPRVFAVCASSSRLIWRGFSLFYANILIFASILIWHLHLNSPALSHCSLDSVSNVPSAEVYSRRLITLKNSSSPLPPHKHSPPRQYSPTRLPSLTLKMPVSCPPLLPTSPAGPMPPITISICWLYCAAIRFSLLLHRHRRHE